MATYKAPNVYIEELPAIGPITGVGTSTAAFIGPAQDGPIRTPTKITNWSQFRDTFGSYLSAPRHYLAHAVEAFFQNGGTVAYIVRVGTAVRAFRNLADRGAGHALRVEALAEGPGGNAIQAQVADAQIVTGATVSKHNAAIASGAASIITLTSAAAANGFRPGDTVIVQGAATRYTIDRIRDADVHVVPNLPAPIAAGTLRIANLIVGQKTFRVTSGDGLEIGSVISITQGATTEDLVVSAYTADFVTTATALTSSYTLAAADGAVTIASYEFDLTITPPAGSAENFLKLSMDPRHSRYFGRIVDSNHVSVRVPDTPSVEAPPDNRPAVATQNLASGAADDPSALSATHYVAGIDTLKRVDDVNFIAIPDRTDQTVQQALIAHCEAMADRVAILDPALNAPPFGTGSIIEQRSALDSQRGYAALYYPRLKVRDPESSNGAMLTVPPSGHIAGIYARSDTQRGVHKAPANEMITAAQDLERILTEEEIGEINIEGISCLRTFPNRARPTVWGARTTAPKAEAPWRYINVRRLMLYIEESIEEGIRWAVFEPNNKALWKKLIRTVSEFLERVWRDGALFGDVAEQAFYVKCDDELNPRSTQALGQVFIEIGVAPVRPAEFVVVRIGQWDGGSEVSEA